MVLLASGSLSVPIHKTSARRHHHGNGETHRKYWMCIKKNEDMALGRSEQNEEKNIAPRLCLHWRVSNITSSQPWHEFLLAWFFETDVEPHHLSHGPHATVSKHLPGCADFPSPFALSLPCWTDAVPVKPSLTRRWGGWAS